MSVPAKSIQGTNLLDLQNIPASTDVLGTPQDTTGKIGAWVFLYLGRTSSTVFTVCPILGVEGSPWAYNFTPVAGAPNAWQVLNADQPVTGTSLTAQAVNGTCTSGQKVVPMTSTTNFAIGDQIYIKNTTLNLSEFGIVASISANTSITIETNLVNAQTGATVYRMAEWWCFPIDLTAFGQIRGFVRSAANTVSIDAMIAINYWNS